MENNRIISAGFQELLNYCESESFIGWDPYDGLNSKLFQATPLRNWAFARLAWIQFFKRNPINFRDLTFVTKGFNPKGLALFLSGYCNLFSIFKKEDYLQKINFLADKLISIKSNGYSGACWGYNFNWQARGGLYFPSGTPTVVATTFVSSALMESYEITRNERYLDTALSSASFIIKDLSRTKKQSGFLFSYAPRKGNNTVYNASLMGSKLLSMCYNYTGKDEYATLSRESVLACVNAQNDDGSWVYGELPSQNWIDSFHTGYNLECLYYYQHYCRDKQFNSAIIKGTDYYISNFFLDNGIPKYYHNKIYPIDIHCPAQFFVTLSKLNCFSKNLILINKVLKWTLDHMQDRKGFFYYQKHKHYTIKIPYMRWSQAFMFYGMSFYESETHSTNTKITNNQINL